ncbi:unnamed protein product [marine sediment metagenome]|uniref:Uncharacterized protein n=1 Tax=marine sediment metagenome TaxID=412755 RepID=X1U9P3_9ZZZZ
MPVSPETGLIVARGPPWSRRKWIQKAPPAWYRNADALSVPQKKACVALGEAAHAAYGTMGKTPYKGISMPAVAVKVAITVPKGEGAHGGKSKEKRRSDAHTAARASLDALKASI